MTRLRELLWTIFEAMEDIAIAPHSKTASHRQPKEYTKGTCTRCGTLTNLRWDVCAPCNYFKDKYGDF